MGGTHKVEEATTLLGQWPRAMNIDSQPLGLLDGREIVIEKQW